MFSLSCKRVDNKEAASGLAADLSEVELEDVADVVGRVIRQLNQVLPVFKCLAELLHTRFGAVHTINPLRGAREKKTTTSKQIMSNFRWKSIYQMMNVQLGRVAGLHLDAEGSALNLRRALLDDEWDAVRAVLSRLGKVNTKQLQSALELFMAALDCERFQALLVAGQRALAKKTQDSPR